jgi:hypothetical protein
MFVPDLSEGNIKSLKANLVIFTADCHLDTNPFCITPCWLILLSDVDIYVEG